MVDTQSPKRPPNMFHSMLGVVEPGQSTACPRAIAILAQAWLAPFLSLPTLRVSIAMAAALGSRMVDGVQMSLPTCPEVPFTAQATRILAFLSCPVIFGDTGEFVSVTFAAPWEVVQAFHRGVDRKPDHPDAQRIKSGEVRYCAYTETFLASDRWRTPVGVRRPPRITAFIAEGKSKEQVMVAARELEAIIFGRLEAPRAPPPEIAAVVAAGPRGPRLSAAALGVANAADAA